MVARIKTEKLPGTVTAGGGLDVMIAEAVASVEFRYCQTSCALIRHCPVSFIGESDPNHEAGQEHQRG